MPKWLWSKWKDLNLRVDRCVWILYWPDVVLIPCRFIYQLRVNTVHEKSTIKSGMGSFGVPVDSLDENGGMSPC
jgi:hypothetical protein